MAKSAEEIIRIVNLIQNNERELANLKRIKNEVEAVLKKFEDTGNKHIRISFNHDGNEWVTPYYGDSYPSDEVKDAIIRDIRKVQEKRCMYILDFEDEIAKLKKSLEQ